MKSEKNALYIFLHMPKCAGSTFRCHIEQNFKKEEIIEFYNRPNYDPINKILDLPNYRKRVEVYLSSLTKEQIDKIKVIYEHWVPYGIHKFFNKTPRYITFLRNPVERVISDYNSLTTRYFDKSLKDKIARDFLLIDGKVPTFEQWLEIKYIPNGMIKLLKANSFIEDNYEGDNKEILKKTLNKFYFIGITENYDEDALFLYHELGMNKFYDNQNISKKYFVPKDYEKTKKMILSKNILDQELYDCAVEINRKFKESNKDYHRVVIYMKIKRTLILPFTNWADTFLPFIYKTSAKLRRRSKSYSRFIDFIKVHKMKNKINC